MPMTQEEAQLLVGQKRIWELKRTTNGVPWKEEEVICTHVEGKAIIDHQGVHIVYSFIWCHYGNGGKVWFSPDAFTAMRFA